MTRVEQAKSGLISEEIQKAAIREGLSPEIVRSAMANGTMVLVKNRKRQIEPLLLGSPSRVKINANIGTSSAHADIKDELEKMRIAVHHGADAIMDLSTCGDLKKIREELLKECPVAIGTVPLYELAIRARERGMSVLQTTADDLFEIITEHCEQGIDFLTVHCGINLQTVARFKEVNRLAGATSRGGTIIME